jgi:mannan endo-1,6-alpha-mannosidase
MMDLCEMKQLCNIDQVSFKAYLARWFAVAAQLAPFTAPQLIPQLQKSGVAAAQTCVGTWESSPEPYACGNRWYWNGYDGNGGVGQQIAALSVISANLISNSTPILSNSTGGTSKGDPGAGVDVGTSLPLYETPKITTGDKLGAAIITILCVWCITVGAWYMLH